MSSESVLDQMISAVITNDIERLIALLDSGADINSRNERGETAFSFACSYNALPAAQALVSRGADINTVDVGGGSPLDWAVCHSSPEFREWLIGVGGRRHDNSFEPWAWPPRRCDLSPDEESDSTGMAC
jgi:ankyrin repeat protein